jgi:hypothetical protein
MMTWSVLKYWELIISNLVWVDMVLEKETFFNSSLYMIFGKNFQQSLGEMLNPFNPHFLFLRPHLLLQLLPATSARLEG